jgi:guanylate kinase
MTHKHGQKIKHSTVWICIKMQNNFIFVISSPSGAGKTTLTQMLLAKQPKLVPSISCTTRPMRNGEQNGKDYFFIDEDEFRRHIEEDKFLEYAKIFGHFYGTLKDTVQKNFACKQNLAFDIDWQGTMQLKERIPEALVSVFILPPSIQELERRLKSRGKDQNNQIELRLATAREEISKHFIYDYVLLNDNLDLCFQQLNTIYEAEQIKRYRHEDKIAHLLD